MKKFLFILILCMSTFIYAEPAPKLIIGVNEGFSPYQNQVMDKHAYIIYYDHEIKQENHNIEGLNINEVLNLMRNQYNIETDYVVVHTKSYGGYSYHFVKLDDETYSFVSGSLPVSHIDPRFVAGLICAIGGFVLLLMECGDVFCYDVEGPAFSFGIIGASLICFSLVWKILFLSHLGVICFWLLLLRFVESFLFDMHLVNLPDYYIHQIKNFYKNYKKRQESKLNPYEKMLKAKEIYEKAAKEYEKSKEKIVWKTIKDKKNE